MQPSPENNNVASGQDAQSTLSTAEILAAAKATWRATPHPFLPWFSDEELLDILVNDPDGSAQVAALFKEREERIWLSSDDGDPLRYGFELSHWQDADELIRTACDFLYVAGGKRASKSEWAAKRIVQTALKYGKGVIWCFQDNHPTSIATQQKLIWKFLPPQIKALNGKLDRRRVHSVNYSPKNGFADGVLVLPNRTAIHFLTYNSEVTDYQGWDIGAPIAPHDLDPNIPNLGAWADENLPLAWLETIRFRAATRGAKVIWTFSTTQGITMTIKEFLGTPKTLKTRYAALLGLRQNLTGLPLGHMPYIQKCSAPKSYAIYFHSDLNVFGLNYENVRALCDGKPSQFIEENAYGYARDVMHKAFPLFGPENIIERKNLPRKGTRYMLTDPGDGSRNWASLWVLVTEDGSHYIYRDWPDAQTYGEWAVPSEKPEQPDGDRGPAQRALGYGVQQLADEWKRLESQRTEDSGQKPEVRPPASGLRPLNVEAPKREDIFCRYIDPRAGNVSHIELHGGTNIIEKFAALEEPLYFQQASGQEKSIGFAHVNTLLWWDKDKPLCALLNAPRLYVCEECQQVIWMFSNYTDRGGEKGGCKDFADLVRYMALADLQYFESNDFVSRAPGRGY